MSYDIIGDPACASPHSALLDAPPSILHAGHFAFMRAVVQGVDRRESWKRYMQGVGTASDEREMKQTIKAIRNAFTAAANHYGRPGADRLVFAKTSSCSIHADGPLALADFISTNDLDGFSETEQLVAFQQQYGKSPQQSVRQQRLIARQLAALTWLQEQLQRGPTLEDMLSVWLAPHLAKRLALKNLFCVSDLLAHIDRYGSRWAAGIGAIGAAKRRWITDWATAHRLRLTSPVVCTQDASLIVPLNRLSQSALMKLGHAATPAPDSGCLIAAHTDVDAVLVWLAAKRRRPTDSLAEPAQAPTWELLTCLSNTQRSYWKEAERFLLWMIIERRVTLATLSVADCHVYENFLSDLPSKWCGRRGHDKNHPAWRPFETSMSPAASTASIAIIRGLYRYLVRQRYLMQSPWDTVRRQAVVSPAAATGAIRSLGCAAWGVVDVQLRDLVPTSANVRLRLAIALLRSTGLRLTQLVRATINDLHILPDTGTWVLRVSHGEKKNAEVALSVEIVAQLRHYLLTRGLDTDLHAQASRRVHLLGRAIDAAERAPWAPCARTEIDPCSGIGAGTLRDQVRAFFQSCASAAGNDAATAQQLRWVGSQAVRTRNKS